MIEFEIDGQQLTAEEGSMIIEAADAAGIYIPRFCYHRKLSVVANCRMCLVEVANARKPVPACATPVTQDMKVLTTSPAALESQREVMKFLLINHPLDCPICDQGGQCELQDLSMGYGASTSDYNEPKRSVASEDIGPLIETWMTRCIHCTRCVRFGEEVAGMRELGVTFRGEHAEIGTYVKHVMQSELSGNVIDLCPVGALTAKPSRYTDRAWELKEHASIAPHDCVGSNIYINSRGQEYAPQRMVMRVTPRNNEAINECWISDRDRFSYEGLYHPDRVTKPLMKKNGEWHEVEWKYALMAVADRLQAIVQHQSADQIAALISPSSTVEESFLMQQLIRGLGGCHIDHRLRTQDFSDQAQLPLKCRLGTTLADLETADAVLLVGSYVRQEQPLLAHRIQKAVTHGAVVMAINPMHYTFTFSVALSTASANLVHELAQVVKAMAELTQSTVDGLDQITVSDTARQMAVELQQARTSQIILGNLASEHPHAAQMRTLAHCLAEMSGSQVGFLEQGANTVGASLAGAVPHHDVAGASVERIGRDAKALLTTDPVRAYLLLNVEPEFDTAYPQQAIETLQNAGCVVSMSAFKSDAMLAYADFILPVAPMGETSGSFINIDDHWQHFNGVSEPHGDAKPAWKVIGVLANFLQIDEMDYRHPHAIHQALSQRMSQCELPVVEQPRTITLPTSTADGLVLALPHMYRIDPLVRRAYALQETIDANASALRVNAKTAQKLGVAGSAQVVVTQNQMTVTCALMINENLADDVVWLPDVTDQPYHWSAFASCHIEPAT